MCAISPVRLNTPAPTTRRCRKATPTKASSTLPFSTAKPERPITTKNGRFVVQTKKANRHLFDQATNTHVIAYGEKVFESATAGDGLIPFEIPLEYRHYDRKAANILIVCSASKAGDYFVGGNSTMWIDDFELVY